VKLIFRAFSILQPHRVYTFGLVLKETPIMGRWYTSNSSMFPLCCDPIFWFVTNLRNENGSGSRKCHGIKHTCTNVKKYKEGSLKQSQVKNTLGIVIPNFWYKSSNNKCGQNFCPQYTIRKDFKLTYQKWTCIFPLELKAKNLMMKKMIESQIIHLILEDPRNMDQMILK